MSEPSHPSILDARSDPDVDDPTGRLAAYLARTQTPLDVLALLTLWIIVIPPGKFGTTTTAYAVAVSIRLTLSAIYAADAIMRARFAQRHWHYAITHPVGLISIAFPPVRVVFSLRLIRSLFRQGHISRFLLGAVMLLFNGAVMVFFLERDAPGANIKTFGNSIWWSIVTVTTIGYGDYTPVTVSGRIVGSIIMGIGVVTLAVITAQVSSSFVDQAARRRGGQPDAESQPAVSLVDLGERLERIEALLAQRREAEE